MSSLCFKSPDLSTAVNTFPPLSAMVLWPISAVSAKLDLNNLSTIWQIGVLSPDWTMVPYRTTLNIKVGLAHSTSLRLHFSCSWSQIVTWKSPLCMKSKFKFGCSPRNLLANTLKASVRCVPVTNRGIKFISQAHPKMANTDSTSVIKSMQSPSVPNLPDVLDSLRSRTSLCISSTSFIVNRILITTSLTSWGNEHSLFLIQLNWCAPHTHFCIPLLL